MISVEKVMNSELESQLRTYFKEKETAYLEIKKENDILRKELRDLRAQTEEKRNSYAESYGFLIDYLRTVDLSNMEIHESDTKAMMERIDGDWNKARRLVYLKCLVDIYLRNDDDNLKISKKKELDPRVSQQLDSFLWNRLCVNYKLLSRLI